MISTMRVAIFSLSLRLRVLMFVIGCLCLLTSCSKPVRVILVNNSGRSIVVDISAHQRTIPSAASSEFTFGQLLENGRILSAGVAYRYTGSLPPRELMLRTNYPEKFALSFEPDGTLRLLKLLPSGATEPLAEQPVGYPLTPLGV